MWRYPIFLCKKSSCLPPTSHVRHVFFWRVQVSDHKVHVAMANLIIIVDHRWDSPKKIQYWARTLATQTIYSNWKVDWHWFIFGSFTKLPIGICAIYFDLKVVFFCCTLFLKIVFFVGAQSCFSGICRWTQQNHRSDEEFAKIGWLMLKAYNSKMSIVFNCLILWWNSWSCTMWFGEIWLISQKISNHINGFWDIQWNLYWNFA